MILHDTAPDFREIETPWEPQPIAWRFVAAATYNIRDKAAITLQVNDPGLNYLVREVQVVTRRDGDTLSVEETLDDLQLVDDQFAYLESTSHAKVAPYEWHVFKDQQGHTRTLARVAIIDGKNVEYISKWSPLAGDPETVADFKTWTASVDAYRESHRLHQADVMRRPLNDIHTPRQYIMGSPRDRSLARTAARSLYLVDIEPILQLDMMHPTLKALPIDTRGERIIT